ncbi:hypothetical protein [Nocardioides malaquae]|nr:hypothetical protein [Nocardioides malaquae]
MESTAPVVASASDHWSINSCSKSSNSAAETSLRGEPRERTTASPPSVC